MLFPFKYKQWNQTIDLCPKQQAHGHSFPLPTVPPSARRTRKRLSLFQAWAEHHSASVNVAARF